MLKPVSILALDEPSAALAAAVASRIAASSGLEDLVQVRAIDPTVILSRVDGEGPPASGAGSGLSEGGPSPSTRLGMTAIAPALSSIHALRQAPNSPLRTRDDISARELVLVVASATSKEAVEIAREIRHLYDMRRLADLYSIELLVLLPDLFAGATEEDYGAAYALLKRTAFEKTFDAVWLLDSMNANRVKFGPLSGTEAYADALAGALTFEAELSGAIPGAFRPRGMEAAFSSFGYAELYFPREAALARLEPRFAAELLRGRLLDGAAAAHPMMAAKQFVLADAFAAPLERIGVEAGQSLFKRFQPKTLVDEKTRSADEVIAAVRTELAAYRGGTHAKNLQSLAAQGDQTATEFASLLTRAVDETLDRDGYPSAIGLLEALVDPLPDLRADTDVAPRNLVTEIHTATAVLDQRLRFVPNHAASDASRRRIRELDQLLQDQKLVADVLDPASAPDQLTAMAEEQRTLRARLPELLFAEETENNAARNAAREAEGTRLAEETAAKEEQLRELFAQRPRVAQALAEALEARRVYLRTQCVWAAVGLLVMVAAWYSFGLPLLATPLGLALFGLYAVLRYVSEIAPRVRQAREALERIHALIETTDKAKNAAHNDEVQFEYDVALRRTALSVLRRTRDAAKGALDALRERFHELESLASSFMPASIASGALAISVLDDADVDGWYERTADDRKLLLRDFPVTRSESRRLPLDELRRRVAEYAAQGFTAFRKFTIADAARLVPEAVLAQRLKRFTEYGAPLIDLRDEDLQAQQAMQRDTTLWLDAGDAPFTALLQRRLPDAVLRPPVDPLRIPALTRFLHYPAYVLGQFDYYRAHYDPARFPESAAAPDLLPAELALSGPVRAAYEQVLLARAFGVLQPTLGDSHLAAAERLASPASAALRQELERELAPRLSVREDVERGLRGLLEGASALSAFDRTVVDNLLTRYGV